ncbi:uncharacterized protein LOC101858077 [Aplysia californica]|uniref:Uncharacterized protein LOC101858077 n=1 Tax=Aplysia californica TaxID=6500 RepID=A0ABM0K8Y1_APLCA|nr:uncharacterized protein LOC101858077 [Aplysia californica]
MAEFLENNLTTQGLILPHVLPASAVIKTRCSQSLSVKTKGRRLGADTHTHKQAFVPNSQAWYSGPDRTLVVVAVAVQQLTGGARNSYLWTGIIVAGWQEFKGSSLPCIGLPEVTCAIQPFTGRRHPASQWPVAFPDPIFGFQSSVGQPQSSLVSPAPPREPENVPCDAAVREQPTCLEDEKQRADYLELTNSAEEERLLLVEPCIKDASSSADRSRPTSEARGHVQVNTLHESCLELDSLSLDCPSTSQAADVNYLHDYSSDVDFSFSFDVPTLPDKPTLVDCLKVQITATMNSCPNNSPPSSPLSPPISQSSSSLFSVSPQNASLLVRALSKSDDSRHCYFIHLTLRPLFADDVIPGSCLRKLPRLVNGIPLGAGFLSRDQLSEIKWRLVEGGHSNLTFISTPLLREEAEESKNCLRDRLAKQAPAIFGDMTVKASLVLSRCLDIEEDFVLNDIAVNLEEGLHFRD